MIKDKTTVYSKVFNTVSTGDLCKQIIERSLYQMEYMVQYREATNETVVNKVNSEYSSISLPKWIEVG